MDKIESFFETVIDYVKEIPDQINIPPFHTAKPKENPLYLPPEPSELPRFRPSRPELVPPELFKLPPNSVASVISKFLNRISSIEAIYFEMLDKEMIYTNNTLSANIEQHILQQKEMQKSAEASDFWDHLKKTAICLVGATSLVLGGILLTTPAAPIMTLVAGGAMLLSGGASIIGNILDTMKVHPHVASALMIAGSGFALIGGISSAIIGISTLNHMLARVAVAGLSIFTNSTQIMKDGYQIQLADMKASYSNVEKSNAISKERMRTMEQEMSQFDETLSRATENCIATQIHHQAAIRKIIALSGPLSAA